MGFNPLSLIGKGVKFVAGDLVDGVVDVLKKTGIVKDPEQEQKMREALLNWSQGVITTVNQTMQAESKSEHWPQYSWRPAIGFAVAIQVLTLSIAFSVLVFKIAMGQGFEDDTINNLSRVMQSMAPLFLVEGGILGVSAGFRGLKQWFQAKNGK